MTNRCSRGSPAGAERLPGSFEREEVVGNPVRADPTLAPPSALAARDGAVSLWSWRQARRARAQSRSAKALATLRDRRCECATGGEKLRDGRTERLRRCRHRCVGRAVLAAWPRAYAWADLVVCRAGALTSASVAGVEALWCVPGTLKTTRQERAYVADRGGAHGTRRRNPTSAWAPRSKSSPSARTCCRWRRRARPRAGARADRGAAIV